MSLIYRVHIYPASNNIRCAVRLRQPFSIIVWYWKRIRNCARQWTPARVFNTGSEISPRRNIHKFRQLLQYTCSIIGHGSAAFNRTTKQVPYPWTLSYISPSHCNLFKMLYKSCISQCMDKIFCVEFQSVPLKFRTKYLTHTLKDVDFIHRWKFKSS